MPRALAEFAAPSPPEMAMSAAAVTGILRREEG